MRVGRHVIRELHRVVAKILPRPTDRRLVEQEVGDVGRLPLGVIACPSAEPIVREGLNVLRCDRASRRMILPKPGTLHGAVAMAQRRVFCCRLALMAMLRMRDNRGQASNASRRVLVSTAVSFVGA